MRSAQRTALLAAARQLAPELSRRAQEAEKLRTMPPEIVAKVRAAGFFRLAVPRELGGLECDPLTIVEVLEEMARADGSAGWTTMIGNTTVLMAWLEPSVAKALVAGNPDFTATSVFAPSGVGRVDPRDGSFVVDGRWSVASGCRHADWHINGFVVMESEQDRKLENWRFGIIPAKAAEIIDTWNVSGLRGTGSHDVAVKNLSLRPEHTIRPFFEPARFAGPLYRFPFATVLASWLGAFPLGVARRALDEFIAIAATKSRKMRPIPLADDEAIQVEVARAEATLRAARALVFESVGDAWTTVCAGGELSRPQRASVVLGALNAARSCRSVVETVFGLAGASALYDESPLQRCFRDLSAGTQHLFFSTGQWEEMGAFLLGKELSGFMV